MRERRSTPTDVADQAWAPGPSTPTLRAADIHVWRADLDALTPAEIQELATRLPAEEGREAQRVAFPSDRRPLSLARAVLLLILSRYVHRDPRVITLVRTTMGKLRL